MIAIYGMGTLGNHPVVVLCGILGYGTALWSLRMAVRHSVELPETGVGEGMREVRGIVYRHAWIATMSLISLFVATCIVNARLARSGATAPASVAHRRHQPVDVRIANRIQAIRDTGDHDAVSGETRCGGGKPVPRRLEQLIIASIHDRTVTVEATTGPCQHEQVGTPPPVEENHPLVERPD
jgi:hypothetical protein